MTGSVKSRVFSRLSSAPLNHQETSGSGAPAPSQNTGVNTAPSSRVTSSADTSEFSGGSKNIYENCVTKLRPVRGIIQLTTTHLVERRKK